MVPAQQLTETAVKGAVESSRTYGEKIFQNSVPKVKDSVKSRKAAPDRRGTPPRGEPEETIHVEEKAELEQLIKTHRK
jgi:hypothetical protein